MSEIKINVDLVVSQISQTIANLQNNSNQTEQVYNEIIGLMNESQGEEVTNLKEQLNTEREMLSETVNLLRAFVNSIDKVANKFQQEDARIGQKIEKAE